MKLSLTNLLLASFAAISLASTPQDHNQVIVSYPKDTPTAVIEEAMEAIRKAGGTIEHEYSLIKGFVAKTSAQVLETVEALGSEHHVLIEEDQTMHTT
ncbi:hypothetical protein LTR62_001711 [Meristemomyces frigidus]|uniref:Inhibitor I9 domain-containing protein n=1 Tax=Meristemomyces frigidus TaxID=1508187 RepID=A0AAN7YBD5_9PEZI|nr:hypothetical protein LTR62_001711 [Meristemomyces frigidus]